MQTGVITADNFSQILRPISQRRQSGELVITSGDDVTKILFDKGKIVEVTKNESTNYEVLLEKLTLAGIMQYEDVEAPQSYEQTCEVFLKTASIKPEEVAREKFQLAVKELIYEQLYSFKPHTGALYSFEMKGIEVETDMLPSIPVNQYLLELPDVEEILTRSSAFEAEPPFEIVQLVPEKKDDIRDFYAEQIGAVLLSGESMIIDDLKLRSLLSDYHFWRGFFQLTDAEILIQAAEEDEGDEETSVQTEYMEDQDAGEPHPEHVSDAEPDQVDTEDVLSFLENAIDESFDAEPIHDSEGEDVTLTQAKEALAESDNQQVEGEETRKSSPSTSSAQNRAPSGMNRTLLHSAAIPHIVNFLILAAVLVCFFVYWQPFFVYMGRA